MLACSVLLPLVRVINFSKFLNMSITILGDLDSECLGVSVLLFGRDFVTDKQTDRQTDRQAGPLHIPSVGSVN